MYVSKEVTPRGILLALPFPSVLFPPRSVAFASGLPISSVSCTMSCYFDLVCAVSQKKQTVDTGLEARMEDPEVPSPAVTLYSGLVPTVHGDDGSGIPTSAAAVAVAVGETMPPTTEDAAGIAAVAAAATARKIETETEPMDPREALRREEEAHRRSCQTREAGWGAEVVEAMTAADTVSSTSHTRARARKKIKASAHTFWED